MTKPQRAPAGLLDAVRKASRGSRSSWSNCSSGWATYGERRLGSALFSGDSALRSL
jgi:hypothetical protein